MILAHAKAGKNPNVAMVGSDLKTHNRYWASGDVTPAAGREFIVLSSRNVLAFGRSVFT
jgi:hypothetical protein